MSVETIEWLRFVHFVGFVLWVGPLMGLCHFINVAADAQGSVREALISNMRAAALSMDIAAAATIGTGLYRALAGPENFFKGAGWLHTKITVVVLGLLTAHGIVRAKLKKVRKGEDAKVPSFVFPLVLASVVGVIYLVVKKPF